MVPSAALLPVVIAGAVATVVVAAACGEAARRGRRIAALSAESAAWQAALRRQEAETLHLADSLLPDIVARLRRGDFPEDVLASLQAPDAHLEVLRSVVDAVTAEEDLRDSAQRAFVNIARRVQAIVHQQAQELREMEDRHGQSPDVFGDLLRIDHGTALIGRLADSIAVLGGARPGRQWSRAVPLYSVMRGAMSRIIDYQRVELHSVSDIAVVGTAVEPLIHALAELLDNATRYSPPQTKVHLTAVDVQSGIAVEIEDGGVSMSEEARGRAERMLKQAQQGIDVYDLGESPRLGLAVVGRLSQAYGFQVSLRPSAYGGVRAVLIVPQELITTVAQATGLAHGIGAASGPRTGAAAAPARGGQGRAGAQGVAQAAQSVAQGRAGAQGVAQVPQAAQAVAQVPQAAQSVAQVPGPRTESTPAVAPAAAPAATPVTASVAEPTASAERAERPLPPMPLAEQRAADPAAVPAQAPTAPRTERPVTGPVNPVDDEAPVVTERTANGLPQRRRRAPADPAPEPRPATEEASDGVQPGMWLAAFQSGLSGETSGAAPAATGNGLRAAQELDAPSASASKGNEQ
ncbi:ATP-binding protein [Streptomyces sp. B-S-A12]|uniref:histidine kinase n=1 Tax=Streptomyces luteolus TaxID=3043615 RepID=A0ABT6T2J5_9ACTN|nr:ATP-binding protein [Streptomyces sp. B-S-A12]MDI3421850.1 ATP-binding protein [Streptomyces sp. B-S-A12]